MALQLFKIADVTVATPQSSITFSSIPSGYTDLVVKLSARGSGTNSNEIRLTFNSNTSSYSNKTLYGSGSTVGSLTTGTAYAYCGETPANSSTVSTFSNTEIYIPNYTGSNNKSISIDSVAENNASTLNNLHLISDLWSNTSAITSISIGLDGSFVWQAQTTATLYGIL